MKGIWRAYKTKEGIPFQVPVGAEVEIIRFMPRRHVLVDYQGTKIHTLQACIRQVKRVPERI